MRVDARTLFVVKGGKALDPDRYKPAVSAGDLPPGQNHAGGHPPGSGQAMGVTKPSVTSILSCLMKHDVIVRKRYGKVYLTDRGVLYARYYDDLLQKILQHFPLEGDFTTEEKEDAALAMAAALPAREVDARCAVLYGE